MKWLFTNDSLRAGWDYYNAAMILQHGDRPEDYLLAHELCVAAIILAGAGERGLIQNSRWLAAASEDRFLESLKRPQRFGTQLSPGIPVDGLVTDRLRELMGCPRLADARAQERHEREKQSVTPTPGR